MKIAVADFIMQCPLDAELIGNFENMLYASNLEHSHKLAEAQNFGEENPSDSRVNRLKKNLESYAIHTELGDYKSNDEYLFWMAMARAKELSQRLAITRGSDATPEWME